MNLNKHIASLLHFHNYVVVPGLGGFIAKEEPARLNSQGNIITPPRKELVFNPALHTGDGLLLQELVKLEGLSYQLAEKTVAETVSSWVSMLDLGRTLQLEGIGQLRKNVDNKIVFRQYSHSNFLATSFGLEVATVAKPSGVGNTSELPAQPTEPQTIVIEQLPVNYKRFRVASLAAIVLLSVSATYLYMLSFNPVMVEEAGLNFFDIPVLSDSEISELEATRELLKETEGVFQNVKSSSSDIVETTPPVITEENVPETISTDSESTTTNSDANIVEANTTDKPTESEPATDPITDPTPEPEVALETAENTTPQESLQLFHVIVSSVSSSDQIEPELKRFRAKGYQPLVLTTEENSYRISIGSFGTKDSASTFKTNIKNDNDISSWILSPKQ